MRKLTLSPRDYKGNFTAAMETVTESQSHAMELFKAVLAEYAQSRESVKASAQELYENSREIAAAGIEATQSWTAANPFTESFKRPWTGSKKWRTPLVSARLRKCPRRLSPCAGDSRLAP